MKPNDSAIQGTIFGIGTDILEIERFKMSMNKYGQRFLDRLFLPEEQQHCLKYHEPANRLCARFCAKEAIVKALGTGFGKNVGFLDIHILNQPSGKPGAHLSERSAKHFGYPHLHLSISHSRNYATATCIAILPTA